MRRGSSFSNVSYAFGPGPISLAVKCLIIANVAMYLVSLVYGPVVSYLAFTPIEVIERYRVWQLATYMFLHGGIFHILFNMLALWMFGTELERIWGTRYFLKFYFVTGIGAGALTVLFSLLPFEFAEAIWYPTTVGASGAIYGLLLAYALYFPDRPILMIVFWVPAKVCVAILAGIALITSLSEVGGVANATHLGGLVVGYLFLKGARMHPLSELKYRYLKWKINRVRKKFDVYSGGRADDWDRHVH
jgi:membrane associated rhomboid family serine protease